jgi:hypothetical protein
VALSAARAELATNIASMQVESIDGSRRWIPITGVAIEPPPSTQKD